MWSTNDSSEQPWSHSSVQGVESTFSSSSEQRSREAELDLSDASMFSTPRLKLSGATSSKSREEEGGAQRGQKSPRTPNSGGGKSPRAPRGHQPKVIPHQVRSPRTPQGFGKIVKKTNEELGLMMPGADRSHMDIFESLTEPTANAEVYGEFVRAKTKQSREVMNERYLRPELVIDTKVTNGKTRSVVNSYVIASRTGFSTTGQGARVSKDSVKAARDFHLPGTFASPLKRLLMRSCRTFQPLNLFSPIPQNAAAKFVRREWSRLSRATQRQNRGTCAFDPRAARTV